MISNKKRKDPLGTEASPTITKRIEQKQVEERIAIGANVVHETIRREGEDELKRSASALAWSGLAAGLSMGFSLVAEALFVAHLPDRPWRPLIAKLTGFAEVVGRGAAPQPGVGGVGVMLKGRLRFSLRRRIRSWCGGEETQTCHSPRPVADSQRQLSDPHDASWDAAPLPRSLSKTPTGAKQP